MGEEALVSKPESGFLVTPDSEARFKLELGQQHFNLRDLLGASFDESLNQGNISLLQRISCLDNILLEMEEDAHLEQSDGSFRSLNGSRRISVTAKKRCKSAEYVLEEVEEKGTLVERISDLEKRVAKLEETMVRISKDNVGLRSIRPDDQTSHNKEHDESLQDDIDVEKHEVAPVSSAHLEPSEREQHYEPLSTHHEELGSSTPKEEGNVSSEGEEISKEDASARAQKSAKKNQLRKWLLKRLHMRSSIRQGGHNNCWSSRKNPQN